MLQTDAELKILLRVLDGERGPMAPAAARELLKIGFSDGDQQRISELSDRASDGKLSPEDEAELEGFINVGHLVAFIRARANRALGSTDKETFS